MESIEKYSLLKSKPLILRFYGLPAIILYIPIYIIATSTENSLFSILALMIIAALHLLIFLFTIWSSSAKATIDYSPCKDINNATHIYVEPPLHHGSAQIVELHKRNLDPCFISPSEVMEKLEPPSMWFNFQKVDYSYDFESNTFSQLTFLVDEPLSYYGNWRGHSIETAAAAKIKWGDNEVDIPIPTFYELLIEQFYQPFFVFQVFSVTLWCLDEYWYFSLFTLLMLVIFECTGAKQRLNNLTMLKSARRKPYNVYVYRSKKWSLMPSNSLVAGDVISLVAGGTTASSSLVNRVKGMSNESHEVVLVPCDLLLLHGGAVVNEAMLTGESIPQLKESFATHLTISSSPNEKLSVFGESGQAHSKCLISGGTEVIQVANDEGSNQFPAPPNQGIPAYVLRTGWNTGHGELLRTMLYAQERVTANNKETFAFIGILLIFAVIASAYVLYHGMQDPEKDKWKLILHAIMVMTSVVPPELPLELSLAINTSLMALHRAGIYCTEPFRIPFAGKVDVCCFDKTGTLTSDDFNVEGLVTDPTSNNMAPVSEASQYNIAILGGCHSLVNVKGKVAGDPLEVTAFQASTWSMRDNNLLSGPISLINTNFRISYQVLRRYPFSSSLRRMSVLLQEPNNKSLILVSKGAPEVLKQFLSKVPANYDESHQYYSQRGYRVLTLAFKDMADSMTSSEALVVTREEMEKNLTFASFLVLSSPLKVDTSKTIRSLLRSSHKILMITGDAPLTASAVARQVKIASNTIENTILLNDSATSWVNVVNSNLTFPYDAGLAKAKKGEVDLIVTGSGLDGAIASGKNVYDLVFLTTVWARISPSQKAQILLSLKDAGHITLMCGDGTNDVGALKNAHVGVSIINNPELEHNEKIVKQKNSIIADSKKGPSEVAAMKSKLSALDDQMQSGVVVKFGDASIASPFTCRSPSISLTTNILRQGRCTLTTTIQMFKILAVNSLINAYSLSILYLHGVKQGDTQATIAGLSIAAFFFFISQSTPLRKLSSERPQSKIFSSYVMSSIASQFIIHLVVLMIAVAIVEPFTVNDELDASSKSNLINELNQTTSDSSLPVDEDAKDKFYPNLINTVVYLVGLLIQSNVFMINYRGHPFMQSLTENVFLFRGLIFIYFVIFVCVLDVFPPLNDLLELVELPNDEFRSILMGLLFMDTLLVYLAETTARRLFSPSVDSDDDKDDDKKKNS